jgi:hypothetical protein
MGITQSKTDALERSQSAGSHCSSKPQPELRDQLKDFTFRNEPVWGSLMKSGGMPSSIKPEDQLERQQTIPAAERWVKRAEAPQRKPKSPSPIGLVQPPTDTMASLHAVKTSNEAEAIARSVTLVSQLPSITRETLERARKVDLTYGTCKPSVVSVHSEPPVIPAAISAKPKTKKKKHRHKSAAGADPEQKSHRRRKTHQDKPKVQLSEEQPH